MIVYILLLCALFLFYIITYMTGLRDPKKWFLVLSAILIILIFGSRHNWYSFSDDGMYYNLYARYIGMPLSEIEFEALSIRDYMFHYMTWGLAQVVRWPQFFLYFEAAAFLSSSFWFIYRYSENPFLSVMVLFGSGLMTFCLTAFRQAMASSFCLIAYAYLEHRAIAGGILRQNVRQNIFGALLYLLAIFMHRSAVVFIIIVAFRKIKRIRAKRLFAGCGAIALLVFRNSVFQWGAELMGKEYNTEFSMSLVGHFIQLAVISAPVLLLFLSSFYRKARYLMSQGDYSMRSAASLVIIAAVGCVFYAVRTFAHVFERLAYYFYPFTSLAYSIALEYSVSKRSKWIANAVFCLLCILLFLWRMKNVRGGTFTFFWQR